MSALRRELLVEKHKNAHLEGELVKLRKSAVEIVSGVRLQAERVGGLGWELNGCTSQAEVVSIMGRVWRVFGFVLFFFLCRFACFF